MGIYHAAVDSDMKQIIHPPEHYSNKAPGVYHPKNPFPGMVMMKNAQGYNFEMIYDSGCPFVYYSSDLENITDSVYEDYLEMFKDGA